MTHGGSPLMHGLQWRTAGESHGPCLIGLLEGLPVGLTVDVDAVQAGMLRRWEAWGRGPRAKFEKDALTVLSGVKKGVTLGTPMALQVGNRDTRIDELPNLSAPRPGHADLAGVLRNQCRDVRAILERASARETAARTAMGEVARQLLTEFSIHVRAGVTAIGGVQGASLPESWEDAVEAVSASEFFGVGVERDAAWKERITQASEDGDSLGGTFEVAVWGCPPGLGGFEQPSDRLDARLMGALAMIPAIKGVESGAGFQVAEMTGKDLHDGIYVGDGESWAGLERRSNRCGGIEGGLTIGTPVRLRAAMKPIPTMRHGADSVDLAKMEESRATYERSDVCSVSAASVASEGVVCLEIASALCARLGATTLAEMKRRYADLGQTGSPADWGSDASDLAGK